MSEALTELRRMPDLAEASPEAVEAAIGAAEPMLHPDEEERAKAAKVATVRKSNEPERLASPALFRGSYKLHHSADVVMVLQPNPPSLPESVRADGTRESWAAVALDKNRWGPIDRQAFFKWERASGRFKAVADPGSEVRDAFEGRGEEKEAAGARGAGHKTGGAVQI